LERCKGCNLVLATFAITGIYAGWRCDQGHNQDVERCQQNPEGGENRYLGGQEGPPKKMRTAILPLLAATTLAPKVATCCDGEQKGCRRRRRMVQYVRLEELEELEVLLFGR